jgi:hypothetical protein
LTYQLLVGTGEIMTTVDAIFRNGAFQPTTPVELPENAHVTLQVEAAASPDEVDAAQLRIYELLSRTFQGGDKDLAARHNEHQP